MLRISLSLITLLFILSCKKEAKPLESLLKVTMTNGDIIYVDPSVIGDPVEWGGYGKDILLVTNLSSLEEVENDFNGEANTEAIVAQLGINEGRPYAAKICADLEAFGFDDWYLPSSGELNEIYLKLGPTNIGGSGQINTSTLWSSSEFTNGFVLIQNMTSGSKTITIKNYLYRCLCVRR